MPKFAFQPERLLDLHHPINPTRANIILEEAYELWLEFCVFIEFRARTGDSNSTSFSVLLGRRQPDLALEYHSVQCKDNPYYVADRHGFTYVDGPSPVAKGTAVTAAGIA